MAIMLTMNAAVFQEVSTLSSAGVQVSVYVQVEEIRGWLGADMPRERWYRVIPWNVYLDRCGSCLFLSSVVASSSIGAIEYNKNHLSNRAIC
jgi:hypothetical protein